MVRSLPPQPGAPLCAFSGCTNYVRMQTRKGGTSSWRPYCSKHRKQRETLSAQEKDKRCAVDGCSTPVMQARNYCAMHVNRLQRFREFQPKNIRPQRLQMRSGICDVSSCDRSTTLNNQGTNFLRYCSAHLYRKRVYGDVIEAVPIPASHGELKEWVKQHGKATS